MKLAFLALALLGFAPSTADDVTARALIDAEGLGGWTADRNKSSCARNEAGTLVVFECAGWVRTVSTVYGDFMLAFETRARGEGTRALLAIMGVEIDRQGQLPPTALGVPLIGKESFRGSRARILMSPLSATAQAEAMRSAGEWQSYVVNRGRDGLHVSLNGTPIMVTGQVRGSDGWIGFLVEGPGLELRNVRLRELGVPPSRYLGAPGALVDGAYLPGPDIVMPKLRREVKPAYSRSAFAARIEGAVIVQCVVEPDGTVSHATVLRPLEETLDQEAIKAAREWRFEPGRRDGSPVPVRVTIELKFAIRK
jgi:TonB family protein